MQHKHTENADCQIKYTFNILSASKMKSGLVILIIDDAVHKVIISRMKIKASLTLSQIYPINISAL